MLGPAPALTARPCTSGMTPTNAENIMIWGQYQYYEEVRSAADRLEGKIERIAPDVRALERQMDRLSLACQAMWELIRDHTSLTEADLDKKILEIDLRDGKADGKIAAVVLECPACGAKTNSKRTTCIMCGAPLHSPNKIGA